MTSSSLFYKDRLIGAADSKKIKRFEGFVVDGAVVGDRRGVVVEEEEDEERVLLLMNGRKTPHWPVVFYGMEGKVSHHVLESSLLTSLFNKEEAEKVVEVLQMLYAEKQERGLSLSDFGVISPFRGQVSLIRKLLRAKNLSEVSVGTVLDFQGQEKPIIILSLVQTKTFGEKAYSTGISEFGLLGNYKQFNVALTRAESYLVVIGDPNYLSKDPYWRQFLLFCLRNSCWYGIKSPISNLVNLDGLIRLQKCPQDQEMYEQSVSPCDMDG